MKNLKSLKKHWAVVLGVALLVACGGDPEPAAVGEGGGDSVVATPAAETGSPKAENGMWADGSRYTDSEIGLASGTLFDTLTPDSFAHSTSEPGDIANLPRAYATSPPRIPHGIADMDPITLDENLCIECHNGVDAKATPLSHLQDGATVEDPAEYLIGMRYGCTLCHVPQSNAKPLVENRFVD